MKALKGFIVSLNFNRDFVDLSLIPGASKSE